MCCADKNFGRERLLITASERLACFRLEDLLCSLGEKCNRALSARFVLSVIAPNVVSRELLGPAKELEKLTEL